jgi:hypothetical protein
LAGSRAGLKGLVLVFIETQEGDMAILRRKVEKLRDRFLCEEKKELMLTFP